MPLEVIRRIDGFGEDQETAAQFVMISRGTVQRVLQEAHHKIAFALVNGMQIYLQGGNYEVIVRDAEVAKRQMHDDVLLVIGMNRMSSYLP